MVDMNEDDPVFRIDDRVVKDGGDYRFEGVVVSTFRKRSGRKRYVVENDDGILHIFQGSNLKRA
jgi:hypothetical protein